jgi:hypothetical protein
MPGGVQFDYAIERSARGFTSPLIPFRRLIEGTGLMCASKLFASALALSLSGCGLYVPEIQENPFDRNAGQHLVQNIALNIRCEIQDAIVGLYAKNAEIDPENRNLKWFDSWAAQVALTLTTDEKGSVSPVSNWIRVPPPVHVFNFNLGGTLSSDAFRVDKISSFFLVSDFKKLKACSPQDRNRGLFILENDLKLKERLFDTMTTADNGNTPIPTGVKGPFKSNVLSHEVKFDIVSSANATPGWKLAEVSVNQSGNLLATSRDRIQDLIITFGPVDPAWTIDPITKKPVKTSPSLSIAASNSMLASEIGNAVSNAIENSTPPGSF